MNREEWEFTYTGKVLHIAAVKKHKMHSGRLCWWKEQKAKVMVEIKRRGLSVEETQAAVYGTMSNNFVGKARDQRAVITVDTRLQEKLDECANKIAAHASRVGEYAAWCEVLRAHPKQSFALNQDDYLFFFGK